MFDYRYRVWLIRYILSVFIPPLALAFITLRIAEVGFDWIPGNLSFVLLYALSSPTYWAAVGHFTEWRNTVNAKKLGARVLPLIRGNRWHNMDLVARFSRGMNNGYVGGIINKLLDEAGVDAARISMFGVDRVITRDHDIVKFILATGFDNFAKGEAAAVRTGSFFRKGIFGSDGERAKMHRALARPFFARERVSDYDSFYKYSEKMVTLMKRVVGAGEAIDVQDLFARLTLDTGGEFLFGKSDLNTLDLPLPKAGTARLGPKGVATDGMYGGFAQAFEEGQTNTRDRLGKPQFFWMAKEFFTDSQAKMYQVITDYLEPMAKAALDRKEKAEANRGSDEEDGMSFLDHLARSTDDVDLVRDQLLNMMLAARDTTAALLSYTCYMLAMHPAVMICLREEIQTTHGKTGVPTYDSLKQLKYLRAVLNETLRLFPPVPLNNREAKRELVIPTRDGPIYIPRKGWQFVWSVPSIHKRKDLWGPDADEFIPGRWLDERAKEIAADPFRFIPFIAGPRMCLGQQFAYNEASFVIVRLLQTFDSFQVAQAEAAPPGSLPPAEWKSGKGRETIEQIHPQSAMTLYSKGGVWLRMHFAA